MRLASTSGRFDDDRLGRVFALFPAMEKFWTKQAFALSGGQKQMLAISRAIIERRELILIDEPTKGLAPAIIRNMIAAFREIAQETTILLVEQNFLFARSLGRGVAVIDDGRIVHHGDMAELAGDGVIRDVDLEATARMLTGASCYAATWIANAEDPQAISTRATAAYRRLVEGLLRDPQ